MLILMPGLASLSRWSKTLLQKQTLPLLFVLEWCARLPLSLMKPLAFPLPLKRHSTLPPLQRKPLAILLPRMSLSAEAGSPEASSAGVEEWNVASGVAETQVASSMKAGVWHTTPERTGVEGFASAAKSCSIWIAKLNQASGSASEGLPGAAEIRRLRPRWNLTTMIFGSVFLESSTRLRNSSRYSLTDCLPW